MTSKEMKRKLIIAVSFFVVLGLCAGFFLYHKPTEKRVTGKADYSVKATQLFTEFSANESAANGKYLNKVVSVSGVITEISAVDSLGISILLETGNPLFGVSCQFPSGNNGKLPARGSNIKIKGLCTGKLMDVVLVKCVFEN